MAQQTKPTSHAPRPAPRPAGQILTIHIGANKTGSSAIQTFLQRNSGWLRERGIVVPDEDLGDTKEVVGNQVWYFEQPAARPKKQSAALAASVEALLAARDVGQVVISAENLSNHDSYAFRWFKDVASQNETEVILYLRRQDDLLLSSWQQWYAKAYPDFWAWLTSCVGVIGNWQLVVRRWESIVGRERMRLRLYERDKLKGGDVVEDFSQFLRLDEAIPEDFRDKRINPSFNEAIVSLIPGSGLFTDAHDAEFYGFIDEMLGATSHKRANESPVSYEQRMAILERYEEGNSWIRNRYFADSDASPTLFSPPLRHEARVPSEIELMKQQIQMLMRLVFEVSKRERRL